MTSVPATVERVYDIALTIPDNEGFTALTTLQRLGVACASIRRSDIWAFSVEPRAALALEGAVRSIETIFNPNKHELALREPARPQAGEVWIANDEDAERAIQAGPVVLAGRTLAGVHRVVRYTAWRLTGHDGEPVERSILDRAVATLLCNPAFQRTLT